MGIEFEKIRCEADMLGESPVWDAEQRCLYWVDTINCRVRRLDPASGEIRAWRTPSLVGSLGLAEKDRLILGLVDGFYVLDLGTTAVAPLWRPHPADPRIRFNDGKTDRTGRFLCGTMGIHADPLGKLYRLGADLGVECLANGIRIANSLCFSPRGETMYFADSLARRIMAYDYAPTGAHVGAPRLLIDTEPLGSGPDGSTVDADGCLWVALVQIGKIARIAPDGRLDRLIEAPVDLPSCPAFGGDRLDVLYLTSIKDSGTGRAVSRHRDGGHLYAIHGLGVTGLPEARFRFA